MDHAKPSLTMMGSCGVNDSPVVWLLGEQNMTREVAENLIRGKQGNGARNHVLTLGRTR